jgi:hypothetical protein
MCHNITFYIHSLLCSLNFRHTMHNSVHFSSCQCHLIRQKYFCTFPYPMTQLVKVKRFHSIACKFSTGEPFFPSGYRTGMLNLRHTCPKWQAERLVWHIAFTAAPFFLFLLPNQHLYIVNNMCIQYTHKSDNVETVYELLLLTNNTASETFLQKSRVVQVLTGDLPMGHWPVLIG